MKRFLVVGKWIVLATHVCFCTILLQIILLAAYQFHTGKPRVQLPEFWDSLIVYCVVAPQVAVIVCWGLFCLGLAVLVRRVLGAGSVRQILTLMRVAIPFWGSRYYDRIVRELITADMESRR